MKNRFTQLASALLVLTLLSTCAVSGTYAKYVTSASATDTARVAQFGVTITSWADNSLFKEEYASDSSQSTPAYTTATVISSDKNTASTETTVIKNVVAPGTKNDGGVNFKVEGSPEVAVRVSFELKGVGENETYKQVCVPAKNAEGNKIEYRDWTTDDENAKFQMGDNNDYYPVRFTLKKKNVDEPVATGTLQEINVALSGISKDYAPNTNLADAEAGVGEYSLSWEWVFTGNDPTDKLDTLLGQVAAEKDSDAKNAGVVTDLAFDLAITVTQID